MPLKDLLSKIPTPVPPTDEPWPKPPPKKVVPPRLKNSDYKNSPLYSATSRPTLDEFLRTNYLMIPEFVKQVNQAKKAAGIGKSGNCVQNTASQQSAVNFEEGLPTVFSGDQNQAVSCNIDEAKTVKNDGATLKHSKTTAEIHKTGTADKIFAKVTSEIQVPPPQKPRVKKVMKGGSLVTIPAPQPRNRAVHSTPGSSENADKTTTSSDKGENAVDVLERRHPKETEKEVCIKEALNKQSAEKEDSSVYNREASHVQKEVSTKGSKHLQTEVLLAKCVEMQVSLTSINNTDILKQSKVSLGSSQDLPVGNNPSKTRAALHEASDILLHSRDTQVPVNKDLVGGCDKSQDKETVKHLKKSSIELGIAAKVSVEKRAEDLIHDHTLGKNIARESIAEKPDTRSEKKIPDFINDSKKSNLVSTDKSFDLPVIEVVVKSADKEVGLVGEGEGESIKEPSNNQEMHADDDKHSSTEVIDHGITGSADGKVGSGDDVKDVYVKDCDVTTADDDCKGKSDDCSFGSNNDSDSGDDNDSDDDDDDDDDGDDDNDIEDSENSKGEGGVSAKDKPVEGESDDEYAELIMEDSNSEEEDEDDFIPGNNSDSDEEEGEIQSDYEPEDMNLDSDTEKSTGGITFFRDTTLRKRRNRSRSKQKEKRKTKNKRKRASKKKAKVEKKAAAERSKGFDSSRKTTNVKEKHIPAAASQISVAKDRSKNQVPDKQNSTETLIKLPENKGAGQSATVEEGSLLSMVSSYAVDVTVAASEKLALKRSRGGQHSKKLKKAKRRAAALERIRRGEPHPRPRRVQLPKPICNFYIQGKCRMGSECSFRHDKSAIVRKRELCKFYTSNSCNLEDECPYMHNSFPCKYFHTGSICRAGDRCKFSHNALTQETSRLLQLLLYPPVQDPVQSAPDKSSAPVGNENPGKSQLIAGISTCKEDTQAAASSPYNLRTSPRKRKLGTDGDSHVIGQKASRQESTSEEANIAGQSSLFFPGLYKDLSM